MFVVYNSQFLPHLLLHCHFTLVHWGPLKTLTTSYWRRFFAHRWSSLIKHQLVASSIDSRKMLKPLTVICLRHCGRSQLVYLGYLFRLLHGVGWFISRDEQKSDWLYKSACSSAWDSILALTCWRDWFHNIFSPSLNRLHYISCLRSEEISFRKRCITERDSSDLN